MTSEKYIEFADANADAYYVVDGVKKLFEFQRLGERRRGEEDERANDFSFAEFAGTLLVVDWNFWRPREYFAPPQTSPTRRTPSLRTSGAANDAKLVFLNVAATLLEAAFGVDGLSDWFEGGA
ncbi:MAG: hypothetical protein IJE97_01535 [Thermoguttaceae bacterium]|nr:hypothetical protein [Thermoguttaceae bacterium]MBQ8285202.1 hypothetical protein [Thermoguttaceae bacterium]